MNNFLVSEPNQYSKKQFSEKLLAIEIRKTQVKMNKPVYLGFSIHDFSEIQIYKSCYDFIKESIIKNKIMLNWHNKQLHHLY